MKRLLLLLAILGSMTASVMAQRHTDELDRGLVVVPANGGGNLISWRRLAHEYYDVTYTVYRNGMMKARNLRTTSYQDTDGSATSNYQVMATINGINGEKSEVAKRWAAYNYTLKNTSTNSGYLDIALATVYDRTGADVTANYSPNDAEMADLDGDGQLEMIIKRLNTVDASTAIGNRLYAPTSKQFAVIDAYDVDWQTGSAQLMWRIDCGPNMVSLNSTEINIIAFDWDEDGKAEVVLRGADNMVVYGSDGKTELFTVGDPAVNTRSTFNSTDGQWCWTHTGAEYLIYMNGQTGEAYQVTDYPLKRLESNETSLDTAWGDNYGHRSSKYFFGAPYLDGRKASLFLGRGIYTRHKFIAMNLDVASHTWTERWRWYNNTKGNWYGQGYHNFIVADVDEDGRDEIVYGSMVIDDNGLGLSTTGLGHGDAQHVSDFDPYRKGLEFFGCLEEKPGMNYRNATTSELYVRTNASKDDGRALMGNFSNKYPGAQGRSVSSAIYSAVSDKAIDEYGGDSFIDWSDLNFRIYFDGDLCSEVLNSPGTAKDASIEKPGLGRLFTTSGCNMNNDSKNNPCFQGDIIGDWREEIILRCGTNVRVYATGIPTTYSMPCLWFDHQYRQAMVWQMMAYNQPPHLSYFIGEMEGITQAPPPLTNTERDEVTDGATISTDHNGFHMMLAGTQDMTVNVADGAAPRVLTVNTPSWVQGNGSNSGIATSYYTHTLTGGAFTGKMHLAKQGDGTLVMPNVVETYTGETNIWAGTLVFDGTLQSSALWLNRFTTLKTDGGTFSAGITMEYASKLLIGGDSEAASTVNTNSLTAKFGSRVVFDLFPEQQQGDQLNADQLTVKSVNWEHGPQYLKPVFEFVCHGPLPADTTIVLGKVTTVVGDIADIVVEGLTATAYELKVSDGSLLLVIGNGGAEQKKGDINGDGQVDVGDIMAIINYMANPVDPEAPATLSLYDLNGDGQVDVGDIMAIINLMAGIPSATARQNTFMRQQ